MSNPAHIDEPQAVTRLVAVPDLTDVLAGDPPEFDDEPVAPIDADQADRWLRRLRILAEQDDADTELANTERARIDLWLTLQQQHRAKDREWLESSLTLHMENHLRTAGPRAAKTIHLPNGDLIARAAPPVYDYDDEEAFVVWAERTGRENLLRFRDPEPDKNAVKAAFPLAPGELAQLQPGTPTTVLAEDRCACMGWKDEPDENCTDCGGHGTTQTTVPGLKVTKQTDKITVVPR
jgi:hypothetical protein